MKYTMPLKLATDTRLYISSIHVILSFALV